MTPRKKSNDPQVENHCFKRYAANIFSVHAFLHGICK